MPLSQITIVGAGLIGGSIALGARRANAAARICAIDRLPRNTCGDNANPERLFDEWVVTTNQTDCERCLNSSSLTILCVPVQTIIDLLPFILNASRGAVTDCGSTKKVVCQSVQTHPARSHFVAGHPMAGHPQGGLENARPDLFEGKKWILCPEGSSAQALATVKNLVTVLGATPIELDCEQHDRSVAITSHLPQIVASALAVHALEHNALQAAGPGFASATRVAGGAEAMWHDIFSTNNQAIGDALIEVSEHLQMLGKQLKDNQVEGTLNTLSRARNSRKSSTQD